MIVKDGCMGGVLPLAVGGLAARRLGGQSLAKVWWCGVVQGQHVHGGRRHGLSWFCQCLYGLCCSSGGWAAKIFPRLGAAGQLGRHVHSVLRNFLLVQWLSALYVAAVSSEVPMKHKVWGPC